MPMGIPAGGFIVERKSLAEHFAGFAGQVGCNFDEQRVFAGLNCGRYVEYEAERDHVAYAHFLYTYKRPSGISHSRIQSVTYQVTSTDSVVRTFAS